MPSFLCWCVIYNHPGYTFGSGETFAFCYRQKHCEKDNWGYLIWSRGRRWTIFKELQGLTDLASQQEESLGKLTQDLCRLCYADCSILVEPNNSENENENKVIVREYSVFNF